MGETEGGNEWNGFTAIYGLFLSVLDKNFLVDLIIRKFS